MGTLAIVLAIITGVLFLVTGGVKVLGIKQSLEIRDHFGFTPNAWRAIGALESAGAVGVLVGLAAPALGVAAAAGLTCLMLGAIANRVKVKDPLLLVIGDVVVLGLAVATALALLAEV